MITNTDIWVINQLFERVENEEITAAQAAANLKEYVQTLEENVKNNKE